MQTADVTAAFCATVVDEWVGLGVRHAVVAPGSRSTPMALALVAQPRLTVHVFHDERSAAFAALGLSSATGVPTVLLCTSGTAAANFHPAVVESSHAEVPILVLTADRPPELQGVGAPQTTDQQRLYGTSVRMFLDVGVPDDDNQGEWRRMAARALRATLDQRSGPVHLNLPFREPLLGSVTEPSVQTSDDSKTARVSTRPLSRVLQPTATTPLATETLSKLAARLDGKRGIIVAGARAGSPEKIARLADTLGWPVIADPLSGCRTTRDTAIRHCDAWLRDPELARRLAPETVLRFGALPASKVFNQWLRDCGADIVAITQSPFLIDPDRRVGMHVVTRVDALCDDLTDIVKPTQSTWLQEWVRVEARSRAAVMSNLREDGPLNEPLVARVATEMCPSGGNLVVSSSMPIRDVEWYAGATDQVRVMSNRGVNGIDGVVSTAVGVALGSGSPTVLLIGDVAFLHDSNGLLGIAQRNIDLRIVVVDNRGGGIFSFLPQRTSLSEQMFEQLFGTPHEVDLVGLAAAHGLAAHYVETAEDLRLALRTNGPAVVFVRTDRSENVLVHDRLNRSIIDAVKVS